MRSPLPDLLREAESLEREFNALQVSSAPADILLEKVKLVYWALRRYRSQLNGQLLPVYQERYHNVSSLLNRLQDR